MPGRLHELSGPEIQEKLSSSSIVLVPIGAIEQHGPHLPMIVDYLIADEVAQAVVDRASDDLDVWMVPTLPFSKSDEHAWSPGTMWLSRDTSQRVLDDLAARVAEMGVQRLVFLNGHGGNSTMLNVACREARRRHGLLTFLVHPFAPPAYSPPSAVDTGELGMGIHGGYDETSVVMHLRPELVKLDRAVRNVPEWLADNEHVRFGGSTQFGWMSDDFGPHGHIGDPTGATAQAGERLFEQAVGHVLASLGEIATFDFPDREP
ncbi:MAG: creatininase family protein [Actinomycetota bacterium]